MKRRVQFLLLFAGLLPVLAGAGEETMEERKRRITRKYLRTRVNVSYSDMVVPDASDASASPVGADEVLASERLKQSQMSLQHQEPSRAMPPPPRQPAPRTKNRNWLLSESTELDDLYTDPYADPFALKGIKDEPKKQTDWRTWGDRRDSSSPYADTQRESRSSWRSYTPSSEQQVDGYGSMQPRGGAFGTPRTYSAEGAPSGFQQRGVLVPNSSDGLDLSGGKSLFNADRNRTKLQSPGAFRSQSTQDSFGSGSTQRRTGGYIPYANPYQTQQSQQQQRGGYVKPEYRKPNTFQQWKKKNPSQLDPMKDDAFINEMMPRTRSY